VRVPQGFHDPLQDRVELVHDLVIPKAQHPIALSTEKLCPSLIALSSRGVLAPIEFDNQPALNATEVGNERTDGMLPAKLYSGESPIPESRPELALGVGLVPTELTCSISRLPRTHPSP